MYRPIPYTRVRITNEFWIERRRVNATKAIPLQYDHCLETGRFDALLLKWKPGQPKQPHIFWDSDVAKWLEAACYAWKSNSDPELRRRIDQVAGLFIGAQRPDGYINSYFTVVAPERRWTNLRGDHELYTAGHFIEAAVAHFEATGTDALLNAACRFADYISTVFGREEGEIPGYPGHEELELALIRLYKATGERRYLDLSAYFVNQRGQKPLWFSVEHGGQQGPFPWTYYQCHLPVREQHEAVGHAVRAVYLYSAIADLARETGDETLLAAVRRLWRSVVDRKMYITAGIGGQSHEESFGPDYDLPNESAYCETCASAGLVFWAHRMLQHEANGEFADEIERALHNGALSGMSLDGGKFFYENRLASRGNLHRSEWFDCACCPSNISRVVASLGGYLYSTDAASLLVHQYIGSEAEFELAGGIRGTLKLEGGYPWTGQVKITIDSNATSEWDLRLRIPSWADGFMVRVNGVPDSPSLQNGYVTLHRAWRTGDAIELDFPMNIRRVAAHPSVIANAGQVALQRGPFVYCIEDADHQAGALNLSLPRAASLEPREDRSLFQIPITVIEGECALHPAPADSTLYFPARPSAGKAPFRAIPYFAWDNRSPGAMRVWIPEGD